ncbi:MAG: response regulator transcription factor [Planctomycetota bacterium]
MNVKPRTRVALIDDHNLVRSGLAALLRLRGDFEVVTEATDGVTGLQRLRTIACDLVILDLAMPRLGGLAVIEELRDSGSDIKILVLSMYDDPQFVARAINAGANGYLLKHAVDEDLFHAIETVLAGESFLSEAIDRDALAECTFCDGELTSREKEVLQLIGEGMTNGDIARTLTISPHTVTRHRANLMKKLNVHNRVELVTVASNRGLLLIPRGGESATARDDGAGH